MIEDGKLLVTFEFTNKEKEDKKLITDTVAVTQININGSLNDFLNDWMKNIKMGLEDNNESIKVGD